MLHLKLEIKKYNLILQTKKFKKKLINFYLIVVLLYLDILTHLN